MKAFLYDWIVTEQYYNENHRKELCFPARQRGIIRARGDTLKMSDLMKKSECKATFTIQIQFQQNATWQGTITWAEGEKSQKFRSELEMLKLMMEAVDADRSDAGKEALSTWK